MDAYNLIQEQLGRINHSLNSGLSRIYEELDQLSQRVRALERANNIDELQSQLDSIREKVDLLPKIHGNQVGTLEMMLVGHQYQFRRLNNIMTQNSSYGGVSNEKARQVDDGGNDDHDNYDDVEDDDQYNEEDEELRSAGKQNTSGASRMQQAAEDDTTSRMGDPISTSTTANTSMAINPGNRVNGTSSRRKVHNSQIPNNSAPEAGTPPHQQARQQLPSNQSQGINVNNRVNVTPLSIISSGNHRQMQSLSAISQQTQGQQGTDSGDLSALRSYPSMSPIDNDISMSSTHSSPGEIDDSDSIPVTNAVNSSATDLDANGRHIWDNVPFTELNPSPKSVREVLDEYYYGYHGQPPLKYLEQHRRSWRKTEKKLSKTFCRRYRIITALEAGTRLYSREYGLSESAAREKIINELENLRIKDNGKKETMYWLFHHIPGHLKKK